MPKKKTENRGAPERDGRRGIRIPDLPCDVEVPKAPPPPKPADSGCSTGTGLRQYRDLLRGKR